MKLLSPQEITRAALGVGERKAAMTTSAVLVQAAMAGAFIALGGILSMVVGFGFPEATAGNPSLQRLLSGAMFPIGLMLVVILGAELFTGNNALLMPGLMRGSITARSVLRNWSLVYLGNFLGAIAFTYLLVYAVGLTAAEPYHCAAIRVATAKVSMPWLTVLLKGVGANWLVCLAVWLALAGKTVTEKMAGCFFPVMAFVALGYEHSIANMFFIPIGMMEGAEISVGQAIWANLIPATIGNILGGALLVGCVNAYAHLRREF